MVFEENETLFLVDEKGKQYWFVLKFEMMKLGGLGSVDGQKFKGLKDGSSVTIAGQKFNVFRPTVTDYIYSLERGAQIILPKDSSAIAMECDVHPGSRVIEIGAGSGGLTFALLNAIGTTGLLHTVDIRQDHIDIAQKNLKRMGNLSNWSTQLADARKDKIDFENADVITVDMPDPENALDNINGNLRSGGRLCVYVPNANQLDLIVRAIRKAGYANVHSMEIMRRDMEVHPGGVRPSFNMLGHTGYLTFARKCSD